LTIKTPNFYLHCPTRPPILGLWDCTVPKMKSYRPTSPKIEQVPIQVIEQVLNKLFRQKN